MSSRDPWVEFVRQHRGDPPPPAPDLEDRIMAEVHQHRPVSRSRAWVWLLGLGLVVPLSWGSLAWLRQPQPMLAQLPSEEELTTFVWNYWEADPLLEESIWLDGQL